MSKSLFSLACGITKAILQSPSRDAIAHALRNSGNVEGAAGLMDPGGTFRYQARKLRMQFAGYLLLNDIVEDTSVEQPFPWKLNRLSEEDWRGITEGDLFVSRVNTGVLNGLSDQLPQIYLDVCDPYHGFRLGKRCQNVEVQFSSALDSAIAELVAGFQAHPALRFLRAAHSLAQAIKPEHVSELALYVRSVVEEDPDRPTDSDIERLRGESQDQDQSANILGALGSHLYSLRKALAIVDGLLYDAFMLDRLVVIS